MTLLQQFKWRELSWLAAWNIAWIASTVLLVLVLLFQAPRGVYTVSIMLIGFLMGQRVRR